MTKPNGAHPVDDLSATLTLDDQRRRSMARALGLDPQEPWPVIEARARQIKTEHGKLMDARAAFLSCHDERPEYVHTRPVCAVSGCDNGPRKDALCAKHYEAQQKGGE